MFNLQIFDVSALLHYGMNSSRYKDDASYGYLVGGIHKVMYHIASAFNNRDSVVLAFDGRNNFRKKLMPEYKIGRASNTAVISQAEMLYENLPRAGITCYKFDGYEGDDVINWCCKQATGYNTVYIYGNDKDLIHNVHDNIVFKNINDGENLVTAANFPYAIERGVYIPFNFINIRKVLTGCKSDKVPPFVSESGLKGADIFDWYLQVLDAKKVDFIYQNTANPDLLLRCIRYIKDLTDKDLEEIQRRIKIIFPAEMPEDFTFTSTAWNKYDKECMEWFLSYVNDFSSIRSLRLHKRNLTDEDKEALRAKQRLLQNGAFAVDRQMVVHDVDAYDDSFITLKEF